MIACAPAIKSVTSNTIVPNVKIALQYQKERWTDSSGSSPPTPSFRFNFPERALHSFPSPMGRKAPSTLRLDSFNNDSTADPDSIELSFNGSSHEYFPSMSTLITTGSENSLRRPHSSKSTVYISREFTIHEEFTDPGKPPPIPARFL